MIDKRTGPGQPPDLGSLDQLDLGRRGPVAPLPAAPPLRWPWPWLLLAAGVLAALLMLGLWREQIGQRLVPDSAINLQIEQAQLALARGELSKADGSGAREQFQAVLARDPDHLAARAGLAQVRDAALQQARAALSAGDLAQARQRLDLARTLAAPAADLAGLERDLERLQGSGADVAATLQRARAAQAAGLLEQVPGGALALYGEVLALQPDNALALEGRRDILSGLLQRAGAALAQGDTASAQALVARVVESDPSHLDLPTVQARLGEALMREQQQRAAALVQASQQRQAGQLEQAAAAYQALLAQAPESAEARQGLADTAADMAARSARLAADFDFEGAQAALDLARQWQPDSPALATAEQRLQSARAARGQLPSADADPARVAELLARASAAMRRGDLAEPPGDSAWDALRQAQALAPGAPGLGDAYAEYDRRARACFEDELASNRLGRAQACLDARALRERGGVALAADTRRLADRWLAYADERLGANELALARRALDSARALDPAHPGLAPMAERLARAGG
jgi:tetratricopeptide (TPR) repeat protein